MFVWTEDCQKAFDGVKWAITADVALALYDPFLYTEASGVGIFVVLYLEQVWEVINSGLCQPHASAGRMQLQHCGTRSPCLRLGGREV